MMMHELRRRRASQSPAQSRGHSTPCLFSRHPKCAYRIGTPNEASCVRTLPVANSPSRFARAASSAGCEVCQGSPRHPRTLDMCDLLGDQVWWDLRGVSLETLTTESIDNGVFSEQNRHGSMNHVASRKWKSYRVSQRVYFLESCRIAVQASRSGDC